MVSDIIGLVGPNCSGKGEIVDYLVEKKGYKKFSLSDMIREEAKARGLDPTDRSILIEIGKELREKEGYGALAERLLPKLGEDTSCKTSYVIDSIRHPDEILALMKKPRFVLASIDSHLLDRWERSNKRNREGKSLSLEEFAALDKAEFSGSGAGQQVGFCMGMSQYRLLNAGTLEDLHEKIERMLPMLGRITQEEYAMTVAHAAKRRATCDRLHAGSAIWDRDTKQIEATGFNGSRPDEAHCDDIGHLMVSGSCKRTWHSEQNAIRFILQRLRDHQFVDVGSPIDVSEEERKYFSRKIISITATPCFDKCYKLIKQVGIPEIHYDDNYRPDPRLFEDAKKSGIVIKQVSLPKYKVF